jgi:hypothetical protein
MGGMVTRDEPDAKPPWGARVGRHHCHLVGNKRLLAVDVIADIVDRTDGIPLFVEESSGFRQLLKINDLRGFWKNN